MTDTLFSRFDSVFPITEGMAGDAKFRCEKDGQTYLVRIADAVELPARRREYEFLQHLNRAQLPVPECIDFGVTNDGQRAYTVLTYLPGEPAETLLPRLSAAEQYDLGLQAGRILRQIHDHSPVSGANWYDRYFSVIQPRLDAYRREGIPFDGSEQVLRFLDENRHLLKARPLCRHHGDYHTGNMIVSEGKLSVIDWHTVDFDNTGDAWYEFNRIAADQPAFARGQIDGYFGGSVPEDFWRVFALYLSVSAITSIVWAKHRAPELLEEIMGLNRRVAELFDKMENPVPKWYRE